jgi:flagellar hook assembly protein FlgD
MHSKVSIYDLMGRELNVLVDEKLQPGYHQFIWDGTDSKGIKAGSGLYFILVQTPEVTRTMKATLLR